MAHNTSISLDDHFSDFLSREVSSGRYRSASEVVRAGLRLLEDQETHLAALLATLVAGEESGAPEPFDFGALRGLVQLLPTLARRNGSPGGQPAGRHLSPLRPTSRAALRQ